MEVGLSLGLPIGAASNGSDAAPILLIVGGQSNPSGVMAISGLGAEYKIPNSEIQVKLPSGEFATLDVNTNNNQVPIESNQYGFPTTLSYQLFDQYEVPIYLVKFAVNGSSLHTDWSPSQSPSTGYYHLLKRMIDDAIFTIIKTHPSFHVRFIWYQGEADGDTQPHVDAYPANITNIIDSYRTDLFIPDLQFDLVGILSTSAPLAAGIRTALSNYAISDDRCDYHDAEGYSTGDGVHLNHAGILELTTALLNDAVFDSSNLVTYSVTYNPILHYTSNNVIMDGLGIEELVDISGNGNNFVQLDTDAQFTITPNALNGFPAITMNGVDQFMELTGLRTIGTTLAVFNYNTDTTFIGFVGLLTELTMSGEPRFIILGLSGQNDFYTTTNQTVNKTEVWINDVKTVDFGTLSEHKVYSGHEYNFDPKELNGLVIGHNSSAFWWGGELLELLVFEEIIPTTVRNEEVNKLLTKYNITY